MKIPMTDLLRPDALQRLLPGYACAAGGPAGLLILLAPDGKKAYMPVAIPDSRYVQLKRVPAALLRSLTVAP